MARNPNCTGAPTYRGRVDVTITYPDPDIQTFDTPEALPTSEPATAQVSMTVASSHLATWTPFELEHVNAAVLYAAGTNSSGSTRIVYYRILLNGQHVYTGSSTVLKGYTYAWSFIGFPPVAQGDVLACKLWANDSGCNWHQKVLDVLPSRVGPKGQVVTDIIFDLTAPPATIGYDARRPDVDIATDKDAARVIPLAPSHDALRLLCTDEAYGMYRIYYGERYRTNTCVTTASGGIARYLGNYRVVHIAYTPLNLRV